MINKKYILGLVITAAVFITGNYSLADNGIDFSDEEKSGVYFKGFSYGSKFAHTTIDSSYVLSGNDDAISTGAIWVHTAGDKYSPKYQGLGLGAAVGYSYGDFDFDIEAIFAESGPKPGGYNIKNAANKITNIIGASENKNYFFVFADKSQVSKTIGDKLPNWQAELEDGLNIVYENKGFNYIAGIVNGYYNLEINSLIKSYVGVGIGVMNSITNYDQHLQYVDFPLQGKIGVEFNMGNIRPYIGYKALYLHGKEQEMESRHFIGYYKEGAEKHNYEDIQNLNVEDATVKVKLRMSHLMHNVEAGFKLLT